MKNDLTLSLGTEILYLEQLYIIKAYLSLSSLLLVNKVTGVEVVVELSVISPIKNECNSFPLVDGGVVHLPDKIWQEAERRAAMIRPLATMSTVPATLAQEVAMKLSISERTVYRLIHRFRQSGGLFVSIP